MTNATLKALVSEFGNRLAIMMLNNSDRIYFGYPSNNVKTDKDGNVIYMKNADGEFLRDTNGKKIPEMVPSLQVTDIQYHTFGDTEFFSVPYTGAHCPGISMRIYHTTALLENVIAMDKGFEDYRPDPLQF